MRATVLKDTLKALFPLRRTVCIEGAPGGGKTTIVQQVAEELGVPCIERHMPTMLVEDFGILFPNGDDKLHYKLPDWYPIKGKAPEQGILLFDDRNQAGADLQKVLANICQARTLHGVPMPDGWMVASTGNRQSDRAGANRVLSHLRNRETVIELETNLDDWTQWALDNNVCAEVVSFIRFRPNLLHDFDPQRDQNPTPRSWVEGVSAVMGTVPSGALFEVVKGAVGEGAAAEFMGFLKVVNGLPNLDNMLQRPSEGAIPSDPATLYAIAGGLAYRATSSNMGNFVACLDRLPAEFSVMAMSIALRRDKALAQSAAFVQWAQSNQSVLF